MTRGKLYGNGGIVPKPTQEPFAWRCSVERVVSGLFDHHFRVETLLRTEVRLSGEFCTSPTKRSEGQRALHESRAAHQPQSIADVVGKHPIRPASLV